MFFFGNFKYLKEVSQSLHSVTKFVRLAPPAPLFNIGRKFAAWHSFTRLGPTFNHGREGILGVFEKVKHILKTFS